MICLQCSPWRVFRSVYTQALVLISLYHIEYHFFYNKIFYIFFYIYFFVFYSLLFFRHCHRCAAVTVPVLDPVL